MNTNEIKKTDMFMIPLSAISANHEENGRFAPRGDVDGLAQSIREFGQKQPVGVKRLKGDTFKLVFGFGRYEALKLINSELPEDRQMPIKAVVVRENDKEQFLSNLVENYERESPTPMDNAVNLRRLVDHYGWSQKEAADFFRKSQGWVSQHLSLLNLTFDTQQLVHTGMLSFSDALAMASNMSEEEQREVVAAINVAKLEAKAESAPEANPVEADKKVVKSAKAAGKQAVAKKLGKDKKPYVPPSKKDVDTVGKRTYNEMRDLFMVLTDSNQFSKEVRTAAAVLLNGMEGKIREDEEFLRMFAASIDRKGMATGGAA